MKTLVERNDEKSVLAQWRGAYGQFWIFDVSLKRVAIRLHRPHEKEALYVTAVGCEHIVGPFSWEGADVSVEIEPPGAEIPTHARVIDKAAGFDLRCSDARVFRGPSTDFEKTFENFLGESS
jgi:hypothetical protein